MDPLLSEKLNESSFTKEKHLLYIYQLWAKQQLHIYSYFHNISSQQQYFSWFSNVYYVSIFEICSNWSTRNHKAQKVTIKTSVREVYIESYNDYL